MRKLVVIESPYAGDVEGNLTYLRACMKHCFSRGEFPFASHGLYTQPGVLNDKVAGERSLGIHAGLCWGEKADVIAFYVDRGISLGMQEAFKFWKSSGKRIEVRWLEVGNPIVLDKEETLGDLLAFAGDLRST